MQLMYFKVVAALAVPVFASCDKSHPWRAPGANDRRSPCPMLNSLANHGFLHHSGLNISVEDLVDAFDHALNLSPDSTLPVAQLAVTTSTTGNSNTLNLDDLDTHGVIEHDGSLSRGDTFFGDNHSFNEAIFSTVAAHFGPHTISIKQAATARTSRIAAARALNPEFTFGPDQDQFSQFETALYLRVFGRGIEGDARTDWVETLFREERIPYAEGFKKSKAVITNDEIVELAQKVKDASPL